jgi:hypothetical protein
VDDLGSLLDASRGSTLATPWSSLLVDYIIAVERWLPSMEASDTQKLAVTLRSMVAACIAPSTERMILAQEGIESGLLERAKRTIQTQLRST